MREYAARVTYPGKTPLLLPTPAGRGHAALWVQKINEDSTPAVAEIVWRPSEDWQVEEVPVLDIFAADQEAEAKRYAAAVEEWQGS